MTNKSLINIDGDFSTRPRRSKKAICTNYYRLNDPSWAQCFSEPYKRIIVVHLTIIFGGFLTMTFVNTAISHSLASSLR